MTNRSLEWDTKSKDTHWMGAELTEQRAKCLNLEEQVRLLGEGGGISELLITRCEFQRTVGSMVSFFHPRGDFRR